MLTDFFVADEADAARVVAAEPPAKEWGAWFAKDLDEIKLTQLWAAIGSSPTVPLPAMRLLYSHSDDGPWVCAVPQPLVVRLAELEGAALQSVGAMWAAAEEFALDRWKTADVLEALSELHAACRQAQAAGKTLLLRIGL